MSTYKELVYLVSDEMKNVSDDSIITLDHIAFVLDKHRASVLKQLYSNIKKEIPEANIQTICVDLEYVDNGNCCCGYLKSVQEIPYTMTIMTPSISTKGCGKSKLNYVSPQRFDYVGSSRYTSNMIYVTIKGDRHIYIKSDNPQFAYLEKVTVAGIFENSLEAAKLKCDNTDISDPDYLIKCDPMESEFPIEAALQPMIVELTLRELLGSLYRPADNENNANDDMSSLYDFMRRNLKSNVQKQIEGGQS